MDIADGQHTYAPVRSPFPLAYEPLSLDTESRCAKRDCQYSRGVRVSGATARGVRVSGPRSGRLSVELYGRLRAAVSCP